MEKGEKKQILELVSNSIFTYVLWIGFGIFMIVILEVMFMIHRAYHIKDFVHILSILISVFMVFIIYTLIYFVYIFYKISFGKIDFLKEENS
jgi:hypothetical protein